MEDNATDLGSMLNDQPAAAPQAAPQPAGPVDSGELPAEPPAAKQAEPEHVPRAALVDERRKRQDLEQRLAAFEQQQQLQRQQAQPQQPQQAPKLEPAQFESYEQYLEAVADAKAEQKVRKLLEEREQATLHQQRQREAFTAAAEAVDPMVADGRAKYSDFEQVVGNPNLPITESMMTLLTVVDGGHDVAYHLGKNPHEAARLARMTPAAQGREIRAMAKQLATPPAPAPAAPPLPKTLTQTRSAGGQFAPQAYDGPTPLNDILGK